MVAEDDASDNAIVLRVGCIDPGNNQGKSMRFL